MYFLSDEVYSEISSEAAASVDPSLRGLLPGLLDVQLGSKASSTVARCIPGDLRDMHVGWSYRSKDRFVKHTVEDRLNVSGFLPPLL